jgi:hypothetical protein
VCHDLHTADWRHRETTHEKRIIMARFNQTARVRAARFGTIGTSYTGTVLSITDEPVPEFEGRRVVGPKRDVRGKIVTQPDITLDAGGENVLIHAGEGIQVAIGQALAKIKADDLEVGDTLTVTYSDEESEDGDEYQTKVYEAVVKKG